MIERIITELSETIKFTSKKLTEINSEEAKKKPLPDKWSKQEILGHLIDSAVNNHQRFVRAQQIEELIFPGYDQDFWVAEQKYNEKNWRELIKFWELYNYHIIHILKNIPEEKLNRVCKIGESESVSFEELIKDYLVHLKHHINQIINL